MQSSANASDVNIDLADTSAADTISVAAASTSHAPTRKRHRIVVEESDDEEEETKEATAEENNAAASSEAVAAAANSNNDSLPLQPTRKLSAFSSSAAAAVVTAAAAASSSSRGRSRPSPVVVAPACADEISALRALNAHDRQYRTAWLPSLTSAVPASSLDARELLTQVMAEALMPHDDNTSTSNNSGAKNTASDRSVLASRRETNDSFLEQLAAKYARPVKQKKKSQEETKETKRKPKSKAAAAETSIAESSSIATAASVAAASSTSSSRSIPKAKRVKSAAADAAPSSAATANTDSSPPTIYSGRPDDMEFVIFQETIGLDKMSVARKKKSNMDNESKTQLS